MSTCNRKDIYTERSIISMIYVNLENGIHRNVCIVNLNMCIVKCMITLYCFQPVYVTKSWRRYDNIVLPKRYSTLECLRRLKWIHHVDTKYKIVRPGAIFAHGYVLRYVTVPVQYTRVQEQKMLTIITWSDAIFLRYQ